MKSYVRAVNLACVELADGGSLRSLFRPQWNEPCFLRLDRTRMGERTRDHDLRWAMSASFNVSARAVAVGTGVVTSSIRTVALPVLGTASGAAWAAGETVMAGRGGDTKRVARLGFARGYCLAATPVMAAEMLAGAVGLAGQVVASSVGALLLSLPLAIAGVALDRVA